MPISIAVFSRRRVRTVVRRTDYTLQFEEDCKMKTSRAQLVTDVKRIEGGLQIEFNDGRAGLFSGDFLNAYKSFALQALRSHLPQFTTRPGISRSSNAD